MTSSTVGASSACRRFSSTYKPLARAAVHRGERLVQQQHAGIAGQRARHRDALLLAAGELARPPLLETRDVRLREPRPRLRIAFGGRPVEERAGDVLERRQVRKQPVVLRDVADGTLARRPVDAVRRVEPDVVVERDATTAWPQQPGDRAQQRRLAAARRADDADDLARGEREVEVERRPVVAERDAQAHRFAGLQPALGQHVGERHGGERDDDEQRAPSRRRRRCRTPARGRRSRSRSSSSRRGSSRRPSARRRTRRACART